MSRALWICAVLLTAGALGYAGYTLGHNPGPDTDAARAAGQAAGERRGQRAGRAEGYKDGFAAGRRRGYEEAYQAAYRRAFAGAFDEVGVASGTTPPDSAPAPDAPSGSAAGAGSD
jgi:hypothetical protein